MADYQGSLTGQQIDALPGKVGELGSLTTTAKSSLVAAVNEVNAKTGGNEVVNIYLAVASGSGSVANVPLSVQVEGENVPRSLTTDSTGKATLNVAHGLAYTITFGTIEGYLPIANMVLRASLSVRNISVTYSVDISSTMEHVRVIMSYAGGTASKAATLNVQTSAGTTSYSVVNDVCEFDVALGTAYTIKFVDVNGFSTPSNQTYTAALPLRITKGYYIGAIAELSWVKTDGTTINFEDVTAGDAPNLVGLRIATSSLVSARSTFIVPLAYLLLDSSIGNKKWCNQNTEFASIGLYDTEAKCLTDDGTNFSGENNTIAVLTEAQNRGLTCEAFTACRNVTATINGVTKNGFLGSYAQMKAFANNRNSINAVCMSVFNKPCVNVTAGIWWTSTQCSAIIAVILWDGGFNIYSKTDSISVVPFLAY